MSQYYILDKIIDKYENSKHDWRGETSGNRSFPIQQSDINRCGRSELLAEARELEERYHLIRGEWYDGHSELCKVKYHLDQMDEIYRFVGRVPKRERIAKDRALVEAYAVQAESAWVKEYYNDQLNDLERGKRPDDLEKYGTRLYRCLNALEKLDSPMLIRVFSNQYLSDADVRGSKVFEEQLKDRVIRIAVRYHPMVDEAMEEDQVLEQLYLTKYSQELALKGDLRIRLNGCEVNLGIFLYGTVLNTETLKHAEICGKQTIKKVISVENKANFVSMPYEPGTLILFSHGFFSPLERGFLRKLRQVLDTLDDASDEKTVYLHSGDLDYGGIRIFKNIRQTIFPRLQSYQMSAEQFDQYQDLASDITDSAWQKLKQVEEPALQPLIERILESRKVIEQEVFLRNEGNSGIKGELGDE